MKRIVRKLALLTAALMLLAVPVLAEESSVMSTMEPGEQGVKNECLLVAKHCENQTDTIMERINRIQSEIKRGTAVYTNDELKKLQNELEDANRNLNDLTLGG